MVWSNDYCIFKRQQPLYQRDIGNIWPVDYNSSSVYSHPQCAYIKSGRGCSRKQASDTSENLQRYQYQATTFLARFRLDMRPPRHGEVPLQNTYITHCIAQSERSSGRINTNLALAKMRVKGPYMQVNSQHRHLPPVICQIFGVSLEQNQFNHIGAGSAYLTW